MHGKMGIVVKKIEAGHAVYKKCTVDAYDFVVPSVSNRCPCPGTCGTLQHVRHAESFECLGRMVIFWKTSASSQTRRVSGSQSEYARLCFSMNHAIQVRDMSPECLAAHCKQCCASAVFRLPTATLRQRTMPASVC